MLRKMNYIAPTTQRQCKEFKRSAIFNEIKEDKEYLDEPQRTRERKS